MRAGVLIEDPSETGKALRRWAAGGKGCILVMKDGSAEILKAGALNFQGQSVAGCRLIGGGRVQVRVENIKMACLLS